MSTQWEVMVEEVNIYRIIITAESGDEAEEIALDVDLSWCDIVDGHAEVLSALPLDRTI